MDSFLFFEIFFSLLATYMPQVGVRVEYTVKSVVLHKDEGKREEVIFFGAYFLG